MIMFASLIFSPSLVLEFCFEIRSSLAVYALSSPNSQHGQQQPLLRPIFLETQATLLQLELAWPWKGCGVHMDSCDSRSHVRCK
jgi:hypothetical protein